MFAPDAYHLARVQFAFTVGFHIIFPAFSIGLATYLAVLEGAWLKTGRRVYLDVYQYWLKIFALVFGVGVVSGLVMSYEFGTNWSAFSYKTGPILGPLLGYETLTAFFLEAGFLGVMLFGIKRVGKDLHFAATCLVAIGTHVSAAWILASNSWMQTPAGYRMVDGRFFPESWLHIIFNPSYPYRFVHMMLAAYLSVALVVGAVGAFHLLRDRANPGARLMFSMAMWMVLCAAPLQIAAGDIQGDNTLQYQPQKVAAMEGDWRHGEPGSGEPLILFALPDQDSQSNRFEIAIPHIGSLYLTHSWTGTIKPLSAFPRENIPYVPVVFYVPHHGRARDGDAGTWRAGWAAAPARPHLRSALVPAHRDRDGAGRIRRHPCRMDGDGGGAPALDRLRPAAHGAERLADRHARGRTLARRVRGRLFHRVRRLHAVSAALDGQTAGDRGARCPIPPAA